MSNVSVEYLVLRDNVEYSRLTAFKGGGAAISVTADAAVKWALSGKFAQNRAVNYLTDVIQPVLTIDGVRRPLGKYIPTDAYTEHDGMRPVVSLTAYDLTYRILPVHYLRRHQRSGRVPDGVPERLCGAGWDGKPVYVCSNRNKGFSCRACR